MFKNTEDFIKNSKCYLLPIRPLFPFYQQDILNKTYQAWKTCWKEVERQTDYIFNNDDFFRQDVVLSLVSPNDEIMGCHLYSFFNLHNQCSSDFSFFKRFDPKYTKHLSNNNINNSFSIEYLTVSENYRGNKEIPLGRAIISLSCQTLKYSNFDGILAQTRDDLNVNKMTMESGGQLVSSGFKMNGIDSSFVAFKKSDIKESPNEQVNTFTNSLWSRRIDLAGMTNNMENKSISSTQIRGVA